MVDFNLNFHQNYHFDFDSILEWRSRFKSSICCECESRVETHNSICWYRKHESRVGHYHWFRWKWAGQRSRGCKSVELTEKVAEEVQGGDHPVPILRGIHLGVGIRLRTQVDLSSLNRRVLKWRLYRRIRRLIFPLSWVDQNISRRKSKVQRVCSSCMGICGIHLGPLRYLSSSTLFQPYIQVSWPSVFDHRAMEFTSAFQYFESVAARELFEFQVCFRKTRLIFVIIDCVVLEYWKCCFEGVLKAFPNVLDHDVCFLVLWTLNLVLMRLWCID